MLKLKIKTENLKIKLVQNINKYYNIIYNTNTGPWYMLIYIFFKLHFHSICTANKLCVTTQNRTLPL